MLQPKKKKNSIRKENDEKTSFFVFRFSFFYTPSASIRRVTRGIYVAAAASKEDRESTQNPTM